MPHLPSRFAGVVAVAVTCVSFPGADAHAAPPSPPANSPARQVAMAPFYPPAARATGIEGQATLSCARSAGAAYIGCALVSESPAGQGFGDAALEIARHTTDVPKVRIGPAPPMPITFQFRLHPPSITPPVLEDPHVVIVADWDPKYRAKSSAAFVKFYPARARAWKITGRAHLVCHLDAEGVTTGCSVFDDPPGIGFAEAALKVVKTFKFQPLVIDDVATPGARIGIPMEFKFPPRQ